MLNEKSLNDLGQKKKNSTICNTLFSGNSYRDGGVLPSKLTYPISFGGILRDFQHNNFD